MLRPRREGPPKDEIKEMVQRELQRRKDSDAKRMEYAGRGGSQVAYFLNKPESRQRTDAEGNKVEIKVEQKGYKDIVAKVSHRHVEAAVMKQYFEHHDPKEVEGNEQWRKLLDLRDMVREKLGDPELLDHELERQKEYQRTLLRYFPNENVLRTRSYKKEVPVSAELVKEIFARHQVTEVVADQDMHVETIVQYQHRIPQEARMNHADETQPAASFGMLYAERFDLKSDEYLALNAMTLGESIEPRPEFLKNFIHKDARGLIEQSKSDPELKALMQDFVRRAMEMANSGDAMMDLAGNGNIRFFKDAEGGWDYLIVDPDAGDQWEGGIRKVNERMGDTVPAQRYEDLQGILNPLNYARALNTYAILLEMDDRVQIIDDMALDETHKDRLLEYLNFSSQAFKDNRLKLNKSSTSEHGSLLPEDQRSPETYYPVKEYEQTKEVELSFQEKDAGDSKQVRDMFKFDVAAEPTEDMSDPQERVDEEDSNTIDF